MSGSSSSSRSSRKVRLKSTGSINKTLSSKGYSTPLRSFHNSISDNDSTQSKSASHKALISSVRENDVSSLSNSTNSGIEDLSCAYDDYLIASLYHLKAEEKSNFVESFVKTEATNIFNAYQELQAQESSHKELLLKIQIEEKKISMYKEIISTPKDDLTDTIDNIHDLVLALEFLHSGLKIKGGALSNEQNNPQIILDNYLKFLNEFKSSFKYPCPESLMHTVRSLEKEISVIHKNYDELNAKAELASDNITRLESLKLSLKRNESDDPINIISIDVPSPITDMEN
ncbi:uncharacterized protein [Lepeophtheirus salmonis]|uniref:uncharacterized protein n=1 Tax=Lepeophtheirus salmonis TaxID=72036 RepID=UPI001AE79272|nr:uncharacterized protein LOC121118347 [Lepeophtheirus salmonis]